MKERTKNSSFSLESLLDSEDTVRRVAIGAVNNMGKIIALFAAILTIAVTFTDVSFGAIISESFASSVVLLLTSSYIIYFSLEDSGERCGEESEEHIAAKKRYREARAKMSADMTEGFRAYLIDYCRSEYEARRRGAIFSLGIKESDIEGYLNGQKQDRRTRRAVRCILRLKPVTLSARDILSDGKPTRKSELESPEGKKLLSLILRLIPSTVCMILTVSVALSAKDGLTATDILNGILRLSALPMIGFKGYVAGYNYSKRKASTWLDTKAQIIEGFKA